MPSLGGDKNRLLSIVLAITFACDFNSFLRSNMIEITLTCVCVFVVVTTFADHQDKGHKKCVPD